VISTAALTSASFAKDDSKATSTATSGTTATTSTDPANTPQPDADNTRQNKLHDGENAVTADQQKNNEQDVEIARKIRKSLTSEKNLSTYAHNVKIIAANGEVTLKGPVRSADEKRKVEEKAAEVAGKEHVKSEIEIAPK
jgi:osmotically-inducible protein OsmY